MGSAFRRNASLACFAGPSGLPSRRRASSPFPRAAGGSPRSSLHMILDPLAAPRALRFRGLAHVANPVLGRVDRVRDRSRERLENHRYPLGPVLPREEGIGALREDSGPGLSLALVSPGHWSGSVRPASRGFRWVYAMARSAASRSRSSIALYRSPLQKRRVVPSSTLSAFPDSLRNSRMNAGSSPRTSVMIRWR